MTHIVVLLKFKGFNHKRVEIVEICQMSGPFKKCKKNVNFFGLLRRPNPVPKLESVKHLLIIFNLWMQTDVDT